MKKSAFGLLCAAMLMASGVLFFTMQQNAVPHAYANELLVKPAVPNQDELLASFLNRYGVFGIDGRRYFTYDHGAVSLNVIYEELPTTFTNEERSLFSPVKRGGKTVYFYSFGDKVPDELKVEEEATEPLCAEKEGEPQSITVEKLASMLRDKRVVFFTGAGISAAAGVHTIAMLHNDLGIDPNIDVDAFVYDAMHKPEELTCRILAFYRAAKMAPPTPAHCALAWLANEMQAQILTGNFDLLHERSGVVPYRVYYDNREALSPENLRRVDVILSIGMREDIRNVLHKYKKANPKGIIVSINKVTPLFLGKCDYTLLGDAQEVLPELQFILKKKSSSCYEFQCSNPLRT